MMRVFVNGYLEFFLNSHRHIRHKHLFRKKHREPLKRGHALAARPLFLMLSGSVVFCFAAAAAN